MSSWYNKSPSNNRNAGRPTCFTAWPGAKSYRNCAKQGSKAAVRAELRNSSSVYFL